MRKGFLVLVLLVPGFLVFPQSRTPQLVTQLEGKADTLPVSDVEVSVRVVGCIAETRVTMTFKNPYHRVLEGELSFPLPEGSTISGYALDINGLMVDGVVVEPREGRRVFEKIVSRGVDPGLAEWVQGNVFRTRVYPIRAGSSRKVMVRYVSEIETGVAGPSYRFPLSFHEKVEELRLKMEVVQPGHAPMTGATAGPSLEFQRWQGGYRTEGSWRNIDLSQDLLVELPRAERIAVYVEKSQGGDYYFLVSDLQPPEPPTVARSAPKRIRILWDASGSLAEMDHSRKLRVLRGYLTQWLRGRPDIELVVFRNHPEPARRFEGNREGVNALVNELEGVAYDGGTQLGGLGEAFGSRPPDLYLLFTDGFANFGAKPLDSFDAPVYAISDSLLTNYPLLRHLADSTGGDCFNLATSDEQQVVHAIGSAAGTGLTVLDKRGKTDEMFWSRPSPNRPSALVGKLLAEEAEIVLGNRGGPRARVGGETRHRLMKSEAVPGELLRTYWAQRKIERLMAEPVRFRQELIDIGREFGLVTPGTSLIVLESLDQYLEFAIAPPASLAYMRAEWESAMRDRKAKAEEEGQGKLEHILELWQKRLEWWKTDFSKRPKKSPRAEQAESAASRQNAPPALAPAAAPATAPAPVSTPSPAEASKAASPEPVSVNRSRPCIVLGDEPEPGTTVGAVKDPSGGFIPGAEVTFTDKRTGTKEVFISDDCGIYRAGRLPHGTYTVSVDMPGFRKEVIDWVPVGRGSGRLDIELRVGDITETVTVTGSAPKLDFSTAAVSSVVSTVSGSGYQPMMLMPGMVMAVDGASGDPSRSLSTFEASQSLQVDLREWDPETPYLTALKEALPGARFQVYLEQRKSYRTSPAFYLDCADFFAEHGQKDLALQILSNIAEVCLADPAFLRILGHRLAQLGYLDLAAQVFEEAFALRPEEPQSLRDLALVLADLGQYPRAVALLTKVVMNKWDRFDEIEVIALNELNRIIPLAKAAGVRDPGLDLRLIQATVADLRVVLTWDADATDIDLWVTEPTGEKAFYENRLTQIGGLVSEDFTDGYGPEEYVLRKAIPGKYRIEVNYFGSDAQKLQGPVTVHVEIYTNFARPTEKRKSVTLRLTDKEEVQHIADVEL